MKIGRGKKKENPLILPDGSDPGKSPRRELLGKSVQPRTSDKEVAKSRVRPQVLRVLTVLTEYSCESF
jgi:hypothetical protein